MPDTNNKHDAEHEHMSDVSGNNSNNNNCDSDTESYTETDSDADTETDDITFPILNPYGVLNEEDEDKISRLLATSSFTDNSDLYVVTIDESPRFYVKDEQAASDKMWEITRQLAVTDFFAGYRTNFCKVSDNEIHIIGSYRLFLISYNTILHRIKYDKIQECA